MNKKFGFAPNILRSNVVKNGMWLYALQFFNIVIPYTTVPYVTRILTASGYGEYSLALNWATYFQLLVEYGFGYSATKKLASLDDIEAEQKLYSNIIWTRGFLCLCAIIPFCLILSFLPVNSGVKICMCLLLLMPIGTVFQHTWFFQGKQDMKLLAVINILSRLFSTILVFVLITTREDVYLYCILYASNYLIAALAGAIIVRKKYHLSIKRCTWKSMVNELKDGWTLFLSSATTKLIGGFGILYLGFCATSEQIGTFSAIQKIATVFLLLWSPVGQALFPAMSKSFAQLGWEKGKQAVYRIARMCFPIFLAIAVVTILLRNRLVLLAFGDEYIKDAVLVIPFVLWVLMGILNNFLGLQILTASGHAKEYSFSITIGAIANVLLTIVLGEFFSSYGVAYAMVLAETVLSFMLALMLKRCNSNFTNKQRQSD